MLVILAMLQIPSRCNSAMLVIRTVPSDPDDNNPRQELCDSPAWSAVLGVAPCGGSRNLLGQAQIQNDVQERRDWEEIEED